MKFKRESTCYFVLLPGLGGLLPEAGQTLAQSIEQGLVSPSGKMAAILSAIESGFSESTSTLEGIKVVANAMAPNAAEAYLASIGEGEATLTAAYGVVVTVGAEGSIMVERAGIILLNLIH